MKKNTRLYGYWHALTIFLGLFFISQSALAQTDQDAIMMTKNNFCTGLMFSHNSWNNYWEGTLKRDNQNLGTVSGNMYAVMGNYGISSKLNILFGLPYIQTKACEGTLHSMKGVQDFSLWIKYMPIEKEVGAGTISIYGIGGISIPASNYVSDYLPLSIGLHSTNLLLRAMVDYQVAHLFATISGTFIVRSKVLIDRTAYYTNQLILSNEVAMPDATSYNIRLGYRSSLGIAEFVLNNFTTQGGLDITRNNMPFLSNRMNATTAGIALKYNVKQVEGLALIGGANYTIAGRNVGEASTYNTGAFYILDFSKKIKKENNEYSKK